MSKRIDITGLKMGRLTVKRPDPDRPSFWLCDCDCGGKRSKDFSAYGGNLRRGITKSCGCLLVEHGRELFITMNKDPEMRSKQLAGQGPWECSEEWYKEQSERQLARWADPDERAKMERHTVRQETRDLLSETMKRM